ncbi:MAG: hypothetical protein JF591_05490 [Lysobacter sp.]|nr:hypothetical protein [Lysobacter sp.]
MLEPRAAAQIARLLRERLQPQHADPQRLEPPLPTALPGAAPRAIAAYS